MQQALHLDSHLGRPAIIRCISMHKTVICYATGGSAGVLALTSGSLSVQASGTPTAEPCLAAPTFLYHLADLRRLFQLPKDSNSKVRRVPTQWNSPATLVDLPWLAERCNLYII